MLANKQLLIEAAEKFIKKVDDDGVSVADTYNELKAALGVGEQAVELEVEGKLKGLKLKRLKKLRVGGYLFDVIWEDGSKSFGAEFHYRTRELKIHIYESDNEENIYHKLSHELMEMAYVEMNVRLNNPGTENDYVFVFDHRQFDSAMYIYSSWMMQFFDFDQNNIGEKDEKQSESN